MSRSSDELARAASSSADASFLRHVARGEDDDTTPRSGLPEGPDWAGPRFEIGRCLGVGGFGAVYAAFDREREAHVALKTPTRRGAAALVRFKQEFRALAHLNHPNLVQLYELHGDEQRWFFTLELIDGRDLLTHLRSANEAELRAALGDLAKGLCFLHEAGCLHRDIKPSNALVTAGGRVVLLDFGLVVELGADADAALGGTPRYMAPELAAGGAFAAASDWYSVGVLLYEALAGRPPFEGTSTQVLEAKATRDPPPLPASAPAALAALCLDLLARDPARRPSGRDVMARLVGSDAEGLSASARRPPHEVVHAPLPSVELVGRRCELDQLGLAFEAARRGQQVLALIHATSGMGKTALVACMRAEFQRCEPAVVILNGRCFERESVPFRALDTLVDDLGRYLGRLPNEQVRAMIPSDAIALVRLFPALGRVAAFADVARSGSIGDLVELRRRAVTAIAELLAAIARRAPLVLCIDDLHWGDRDGGALLVELVRGRSVPGLLFVATYRSDEANRSECLRLVLPALLAPTEAELPFQRVQIALAPLSEVEARALAAQLLPRGGTHAHAVAYESGGSPFFVRELCRFLRERAPLASEALTAMSPVGAMIEARVTALPEAARRLLGVIAVAGQPLARGVAATAAELGEREPSSVALLQSASLVRMRSGDGEEIEPYHDRIREAVLVGLASETRALCHRGLARALIDAGGADPERLAIHVEGGGDRAGASRLWEEAADRELAALGFDRAASLYRHVLALIEDAEPERTRVLTARLGAALAHAGRSAEASRAYAAAAAGDDGDGAFELRRLAAEHSLVSGDFDAGLTRFSAVLAQLGLRMPRSSLGAMLGALGWTLLLALRGIGFRPRPEAEIPARELARVDATLTATLTLSMVDPALTLYFHKRTLWLALRAGDRFRALRALTFDLFMRAAVRGGRPPSRSERRIEKMVAALHAQVPASDPRAPAVDGLVALSEGFASMLRGEHLAARDALEYAEARLVACPIRLGNSLGMARTWLGYTLWALGQWQEMEKRLAAYLADARERGDRFAEIQLRVWSGIVELMADRPEQAAAEVAALEADAPRADRGRSLGKHVDALMTALYQEDGAGEAALRLVRRHWGAAAPRRVARLSALVGAAMLMQEGAAQLAGAADAAPRERKKRLAAAERAAQHLARLTLPYAQATGAAYRAGVAAGRGERDRAIALLVAVEVRFAALEMTVHEASARRRRGELVGGDAGEALIATADATLRTRGVQNPRRMVSAILPGRW